MLNAEQITNAIRDGMQSAVEKERAEKLQLLEIAQIAIEGWRNAAAETDQDFELALARLDAAKETIR